MIELAPLMHMEVTLEPIRDLGETPLGRRRIIGITGGRFSGPRLSGTVLPGGADWQLIRADGVACLDARYTLETADARYAWLNRTVCVASGARRPAAVKLDFYEVK